MKKIYTFLVSNNILIKLKVDIRNLNKKTSMKCFLLRTRENLNLFQLFLFFFLS